MKRLCIIWKVKRGLLTRRNQNQERNQSQLETLVEWERPCQARTLDQMLHNLKSCAPTNEQKPWKTGEMRQATIFLLFALRHILSLIHYLMNRKTMMLDPNSLFRLLFPADVKNSKARWTCLSWLELQKGVRRKRKRRKKTRKHSKVQPHSQLWSDKKQLNFSEHDQIRQLLFFLFAI